MYERNRQVSKVAGYRRFGFGGGGGVHSHSVAASSRAACGPPRGDVTTPPIFTVSLAPSPLPASGTAYTPRLTLQKTGFS